MWNYQFKWGHVLCVISILFSLFLQTNSIVMAEVSEDQWELISQFGGSTQAVAVEGNTVYVGKGLRINVLDVSDPVNPLLMGMSDTFSDMILDIAIEGNTAFVAAGKAGLQIVDVTHPAEPKLIGQWTSIGYAEGVAVIGNAVFLANGPAGITLIDVSDTANPKAVNTLFPDHYVFDVITLGNYAYAAAADSGLLVMSINGNNQVEELGKLDTFGMAYELVGKDNLLYIADAWEGVEVIDVSDPNSPSQLANLPTTGWSLGVDVSGSRLVSINGVQGCDIFDLSTPTKPVKKGTYLKERSEGDTSSRRGVIKGDFLYLADTVNGLRALDITDASQPVQVGSFSQLSYARRLVIKDDYAYVATASEGAMYVINVADPFSPYQVSKFQADGIAVDVVLNGNYATLGTFEDSSNCYTVIDVSDPADPRQASAMSIQSLECGSPRQMVALDNYVYSADEFGLGIYDLSNPNSIKTLGKINLDQENDQTVALAVSGNYAYVADAGSGLKIVDVSDPNDPKFVRAFAPEEMAGSIFSANGGEMLYVGQYSSGILAAANANPGENPVSLGRYQTRGSVEETTVQGDILVASEGKGGLEILDVSDPADMRLLQTIETPGFAWASVVSDDVIIVADGDLGLLFYQRESASNAQAHTAPVYPVSKTNSIGVIPGGETPRFPKDIKKVEPAGTCTVVTTSERGEGSLRECLSKAAPGEVIAFDPQVFPPDNPSLITLTSQLPDLDDGSVTIDGSHAGVILDGNYQVPVGLKVSSSYNTIMGIQFIHFTMDGMTIDFPSQYNQIGGDHTLGEAPSGQGNVFYGNQNGLRVLFAQNNTIKGNFIGTNDKGTAAAEPNSMGIALSNYAMNNYIGGASVGEKNIISNNGRGLDIASNSVSFNIVAGNYVGTDVTGTSAIPNTDWGILIEVGGRNNIIGGTTPEERNIISGNPDGVVVSDYGSSQNSIIGNYIGTDVTGTKPIPNNGGSGIFQSMYNRIGGTRPGESNLISANNDKGVRIFGIGAVHAIVLGNTIGSSADSATSLPNMLAIFVDGGTHSLIGGLGEGSGNNLISNNMGIEIGFAGTETNWIAGNQISGNNQGGITVDNFASNNFLVRNVITESNPGVLIIQGQGNLLRANSISGNEFAGIEIREGGNLELPSPVLNQDTSEAISGTACPNCIVEIFSDPKDQGLIYEGSVQADAEGNFVFQQMVEGPMVTATATDPQGNTSPFSESVSLQQ